jgi:hypothetical protein
MNPYHNLPPEQHMVQRLVDLWNADECLWRKLEPRRRLRRAFRKNLNKTQLLELDLREFAKAKPPLDCLGQPFPGLNRGSEP